MAIARVKAPKQVGRYQLTYELAPSYLGPLWAARVEGGDAAGLAMLRLVSLARLDADTRVRLLEAAWQAMEVRDDRVASVTDVVASDGELCIVSEYREGLPLRAMAGLANVRRKLIPVSVALRLIIDLTDGVLALHRAMTELGDEAVPLYGGLSADSVFVGTDGRASVLDVAIASAASSVESLGGSPERIVYAAPEQVGAGGPVDARTDVFSLGILAWELFSSRRLFSGSDKSVGQKVLAAKIPRLDDATRKGDQEIPKPLILSILQALAREPSGRFQSVSEFRAALDTPALKPATPAEAAEYVALIGDGALSRTRDALSLPPKPRQATATPARAAPSAVNVRPGVRPSMDPKPGAVRVPKPSGPEPKNVIARPAAATTAAVNLAKPAPANVPAWPGPPGPGPTSIAPQTTTPIGVSKSIEPMPMPASATPSLTPQPGEGWRALEPRTPARSVPPAKVRPRQVTMIGLPPPADSRAEAIVPRALPMTEPPPSSGDEPTTQYSRDHLLKLAEMRAAPAAPAAAPLPLPPTPARESGPALPRLETVRPTARPLAEIHTDRPPAPDPAAEVAVESWPGVHASFPQKATTPPPASVSSPTAETLPPPAARVAADLPPARADAPPFEPFTAPSPARLDVAFPNARAESALTPRERSIAPRKGDSIAAPGRAMERPAFSRPPPATPSASYAPSPIAPPLIHDPRANRGVSDVPAQAPQFTRGVVIGVMVSLGLVVLSAIVTLLVLRGRDAGNEVDESRAAAAVPAANSKLEGSALPAASAEAVAPGEPADPSKAVAAPPPSEPPAVVDPATAAAAPAVDPATVAAAPAVAPKTGAPAPAGPTRAAAPHATHAPHKTGKKHPRFVPADI